MRTNNIIIEKIGNRIKTLNWSFANVYSSVEFDIPENGYICFGALMRGHGFLPFGKNNGTVILKIYKTLQINNEGYNAIYYKDNKLNFSIDEVTEILNYLKLNFPFMNYSIEEQYDCIKLYLTFTEATRPQILLILNMCRRFYRFLLSVTLRIAYNIWKSDKYNLSLLELVFLIDNMYMWSMGDDLFLSGVFNNDPGRICFDSYHRFDPNCLNEVLERMNYHIFRNNINRNLFPVDRLTNIQLNRSIKRNIEDKFDKYDSYEKVFNAYVHYLSYYINKKLKEYKDSNCIE